MWSKTVTEETGRKNDRTLMGEASEMSAYLMREHNITNKQKIPQNLDTNNGS